MLGEGIFSPTHVLFVLVVALLVLGPKRLPEVGRSLGRGLRDFRQGMQGIEAEARSVFHDAGDEPTQSATPASTAVQASASAAQTMSHVSSHAAPAPHFVVTPSPEQGKGTATVASSSTTATAVAAEPDPADYAD